MNLLKRIQAKKEKARKAKENLKPKQHETQDTRLPAGQVLVEKWPVLDLGVQPAIDLDAWRLKIGGAVAHPLCLTWDEFHALPQREFVSDIHCVTTWSRFDNHWRGVATQDLLQKVAPHKNVAFVLVRSFDGYTTNMTLHNFADKNCLLATHWEGEPLTREHGAPLRLIIPHLYLWKSAKWVKELIFSTQDERGFWEQNGYHNDANPWNEERYSWQE